MENKQKVLIVHNYYQIPGGEDSVVQNEKSLLEKHGHQVLLYTRHNKELQSQSILKRLALPITTIFNVKTYYDIKRMIRSEKIDIVHVHNTLNLISPAVYYAGVRMRKPVVQTIHNFRLLCPAATFYREGKICEDCVARGLHCAVMHRCYRDSWLQTIACVINTKVHRLTKIYGKLMYICLTEFNRTKLLQFQQLKPEQVAVKPNFSWNEDAAEIQKQRKEQFLFAARLDDLKGIKELLEAWKGLGDQAPLLLVCGEGPCGEWCAEFIQKNQLDTIQLCGKVSVEQVKKYMAESKALILPTKWYEGFPMTIVEAYSVGTPVIGPNFGNVGSLIQEGKTGWKYEGTGAKEISRLIVKVKKSDLDYKAIRAFYDLHYSEEHNYQKLIEIYKKAAGV